MENKSWISTRTAGTEVDISARTIQEWCKAKRIEGAVKFGRDWRIPKQKWEEFKKRLMKAA